MFSGLAKPGLHVESMRGVPWRSEDGSNPREHPSDHFPLLSAAKSRLAGIHRLLPLPLCDFATLRLLDRAEYRLRVEDRCVRILSSFSPFSLFLPARRDSIVFSQHASTSLVAALLR